MIDHIAPGADKDPDFIKMQRELEDTQQRQGWLFGRGAFDRTDIMYLKEQKEEERTKEQELNDIASSEFARLRSAVSAELDATLSQPGVMLVATKQKKEIKPVSKLLPIKIASTKLSTQPGLLTTDKACSEGKRDRPSDLDGETDAKQARHDKTEDAGGGLAGLLAYSDDSDDEPSSKVQDPDPKHA